jgi:hypothetical protein
MVRVQGKRGLFVLSLVVTACGGSANSGSPAGDGGSAGSAGSALAGGNAAGTAGQASGGTASNNGGAATSGGFANGGVSGSDSPAGGAGATGAAGNGAGGCTSELALKRAIPDVLLVLDRSASMQDPPDGATALTSKWNLLVPALSEVITSTDATIAWGLKSFPEGELGECVAGDVTDHVDVPIATANASALTPAIQALTPQGNGTPTSDAIDAAVAYLTATDDQRPKFLLLATDGAPSCAGTIKDSTQASAAAIQAITNALSAGFPTFVLGISTTKISATTTLNAMATAGGRARSSADPTAPLFYPVATASDLTLTLQTIALAVSPCLFALDAAPANPAAVQISADGALVARDTSHANGWDYADSGQLSIQLFGAACSDLAAAAHVTLDTGDCG